MDRTEIVIGGLYLVKLCWGMARVRVDAIRQVESVRRPDYWGPQRFITRYECTSLDTGRPVTLTSTARFCVRLD